MGPPNRKELAKIPSENPIQYSQKKIRSHPSKHRLMKSPPIFLGANKVSETKSQGHLKKLPIQVWCGPLAITLPFNRTSEAPCNHGWIQLAIDITVQYASLRRCPAQPYTEPEKKKCNTETSASPTPPV